MRNKLRTLLTVLLVCICIGADAASPMVRRLKELPPFERAILIIKHYETLHRPEHWPTIGYGHVVQPGEPYRKGVQLTESQADALLRKDLRKFCALFSRYGADSLLLACVSYNCGPYRILGNGRDIPKSRLLRKLESGNREIFTEYISYCKWQGHKIESIRRRRIIEYLLLYAE